MYYYYCRGWNLTKKGFGLQTMLTVNPSVGLGYPCAGKIAYVCTNNVVIKNVCTLAYSSPMQFRFPIMKRRMYYLTNISLRDQYITNAEWNDLPFQFIAKLPIRKETLWSKIFGISPDIDIVIVWIEVCHYQGPLQMNPNEQFCLKAFAESHLTFRMT